VFLTVDLDYAKSYARRAVSKWGGKPMEVEPIEPVKQFAGRPGKTAFHAPGATVKRVMRV